MKTFVMCFVLMSAAVAFALDVSGTVVDSVTLEAIPGANVYLEEMKKIGAAASIDGKFTVKNVPSGNWTFSVTAMGYGKSSKVVPIGDEKDVELDFQLFPSVFKGDVVTVTATREPRVAKELPIRTEVITSENILEKGASDLYEAFEGEPGIRVEQQCSNCNFSMLRVAGLEGGYAEMLIDGQPIFTGLAGVYGLQQIQAANIEQIEIVKGAGSALYGPNALGGVVNIRMREPGPIPVMNLGFSIGEKETYSFNFGGTMRKNRLAVSYSFQSDVKGEIDQTGNVSPSFVEDGDYDDAGADGYTDRVKSNDYGAALKVHVYEPTGVGSKLNVFGRAMGEFRKGGFIETFDDPFDPDAEHIRTRRYESGIGYSHDFSRGSRAELNLTYVDNYRNATNGAAWDKAIEAGMLDDDLELTTEGQDYIDEYGMRAFKDNFFPLPFISQENLYLADATYSHPLPWAGDIMVGAQYRRSDLDQDINGDDTDEKSADDMGFFAQLDIFPFTEKCEIILGSRYDLHNSSDKSTNLDYETSAFNPRIAARYGFTDDFILRASLGTGFRVPYLFAEDLHLCASSPKIYKGDDLKPEKAMSISVGVDYEIAYHQLGLSFFDTRIDDKVEFIDPEGGDVPAGYDFRWSNVGKAYTNGVEFYVEGIPLYWLEYRANAVYTNAKFEELRDPDDENSDHIPRSPAITANASVKFRPGKFGVNFGADYTGSMYIDHVPEEDEANYILEETDPYVIFNARIGYDILDNVELFVKGRNLFDYTQPTRDITDAAYMYAPLYGRTISAGINVSLNP